MYSNWTKRPKKKEKKKKNLEKSLDFTCCLSIQGHIETPAQGKRAAFVLVDVARQRVVRMT